MTIAKIFTPGTVYNELTITVGEQVIQKEDIVQFKTFQKIDEFGLSATLEIIDTYDLNNNGLTQFNANTVVSVSMTDFFKTTAIRTFRILDCIVNIHRESHKSYSFDLIDEITYTLSNAFISKGFNDTPVNAIRAYFKELSIDTMISNDKLLLDIVDTSTVSQFVVPQNESVLDFFIYLFKQENIRFYQSRNAIHIKEIIPSALSLALDSTGAIVEYSNNTTNNNYMYKIHDFQQSTNGLSTAAEYPVTETFRFNGDKIISSSTLNLQDVASDFAINKPITFSDFQSSTGIKFNKQEIFLTKNQRHDLFNKYMQYQEISIVTPGDFKCQLLSLVKASFKGNAIFKESATKGDVASSGNFVIVQIDECVLIDKFVQKIVLQRLN